MIVRLREELIFEADGTGLYRSGNGKTVTVNNTGMRPLLLFVRLFFQKSNLKQDSF